MSNRHANPERRLFLWDHISENWPELWDQPPPLKMSDGLRKRLITDLAGFITATLPPARPATMSAAKAASQRRKNSRVQAANNVRDWLTDPNLFDPRIDEVAMGRALAWDWDAIANLSISETREFYARLAQMDDPFLLEEEDRDGQNRAVSASDHRLAWMAGSVTDRDRVGMGVARCRAKNRQEVAA